MASVTFTFGPRSKTFTVAAQSVTRFQAWALAQYPTVSDGNGGTIPNPDPVTSVIDGLWSGLRASVIAYEKAQAVAAVATPADLT